MKAVKYFYQSDSQNCRKTDAFIASLCRLNPDYASIPIERIEGGAAANVPALYVDGVKLHEGAATLGMIKDVLDAALK